jgi:hypothetical protein
VQKKHLPKRHVLQAVGVAAGVGLAICLGANWDEVATAVGVPKPLTAQEIVAKDLNWAKQESASGMNFGMASVHELFGQGRQGVREFVDDALGWNSKFKLVKDYFSNGEEHSEFIEDQFSEHIFSDEQLEEAIEASVSSYVTYLDDVDSQLLIRLQMDLADVPKEQFAPSVDRDAIRQLLDNALSEAKTAAESEFGPAVGREIASLVAGEVLTLVASELATSSGILSAAAASGTVTLGVGLVVGLVADSLVTWIYEKAYDPRGELAKRVNQQLDQLEQLIVVGSSEQPGLQKRLEDYSLRRSQAREAAIRAAIFPSAQTVGL